MTLKTGAWRICWAWVVASFVLAGCGSRKEPSLFPTELGSTWSYSGDTENVAVTQEAKITSSREDTGKRTVVVQWSIGGKPVQDETYSLTDREVTRVRAGESGQTILDPPLPILALPLAEGKRWTWKGHIFEPGAQGMPATAVGRFAAREKITTKAGEFDAYRVLVSMTITYLDGKRQQTNGTTMWFAPGVGIVKQLTDQTTPDGVTRQSSRELTKFNIAP